MQLLIWDPKHETLDDFNARLAHECLEEEDFFGCHAEALQDRFVVKLYSVYDMPQKLGVFNRVLPVLYEVPLANANIEAQISAWIKALEAVNETMILHDVQFVSLGSALYVLFVLAEVTEEFTQAVFGDLDDAEDHADGEVSDDQQSRHK